MRAGRILAIIHDEQCTDPHVGMKLVYYACDETGAFDPVLTVNEKTAVEKHIEECTACSSELAVLRDGAEYVMSDPSLQRHLERDLCNHDGIG